MEDGARRNGQRAQLGTELFKQLAELELVVRRRFYVLVAVAFLEAAHLLQDHLERVHRVEESAQICWLTTTII